MTDIAPELHARIARLYASGMAANPIIQDLWTRDHKTYSDAQVFAIQTGKSASRAMTTILRPDILPDRRMYFNIAERTVRPALEACFESVTDFCAEVQKNINRTAGIGIKAIKPALNDDRIRGMVDRLTEAELFEDILWMLDAPVVNFSQAVVDDYARKNADFHREAGLAPKIERTSVDGCCEWCSGLLGTYTYDADFMADHEDIFRRHDNCNCVVNYVPGSGSKRQNVWSKRWT